MSKSAEMRRQQARREQQFEDALRENFKKVQSQAIAAGAYAMCKVILEKASAEDKTDTEKLRDIIDFCMISVRKRGGDTPEEKKDEV